MSEKNKNLPYLIIKFNLWAFVLDGLGIGLILIFLGLAASFSWWLVLPGLIPGFYCLSEGIRIHGTTGAKFRAYAILLGKNRKELRPDTFGPFLKAPCGRILVKTVLKDLGKLQEYPNLKKDLGAPFCQFDEPTGVKLIFPKGDEHVL